VDILGIVVIGTLDVLVPAALAAWVIIQNVRSHRTRRTELLFWSLAGLALILPLLLGVEGIIGIPGYNGERVIPTTMLTFPGCFVPMIATVSLSGVFFDDASWASIGYFTVMPSYLVGLVLWQLVVITGIRRLVQLGRRRERQPERVGPHPAKRAVAGRAADSQTADQLDRCDA
jgi:hypothetical protein